MFSEGLNVIHSDTEVYLYGILDVLAKPVRPSVTLAVHMLILNAGIRCPPFGLPLQDWRDGGKSSIPSTALRLAHHACTCFRPASQDGYVVACCDFYTRLFV